MPQNRRPRQPEQIWQQTIAALNTLTGATAQYLGKIVVANTWRSTRPDSEALENLQLNRDGQFSMATNAKAKANETISIEDKEAVHKWVKQFGRRCAITIRDYPERVVKQALDAQQQTILGIDA